MIQRVLTIRELRDGLAQTIRDVQQGPPVFAGSHRKPEVVLMSAQRYEQLISDHERARREVVVAEAIATNRLEGLEGSPEMLEAMRAWAAGEIEFDEVERRRRARVPG